MDNINMQPGSWDWVLAELIIELITEYYGWILTSQMFSLYMKTESVLKFWLNSTSV